MKEEHVSEVMSRGALSVFDREVVQEFLWLSPELKNMYYKAPPSVHGITQLSFDQSTKVGFNCGFLVLARIMLRRLVPKGQLVNQRSDLIVDFPVGGSSPLGEI